MGLDQNYIIEVLTRAFFLLAVGFVIGLFVGKAIWGV